MSNMAMSFDTARAPKRAGGRNRLAYLIQDDADRASSCRTADIQPSVATARILPPVLLFKRAEGKSVSLSLLPRALPGRRRS